MTDITMPRLSDSMEEGTILRWLKRDGESVQAGEDLVEIETDKATVTHPAEAGGALQIVVEEGGSVPVGEVIARVGEKAAVKDEAGLPPSADVPTPPPPSNGAEPAAVSGSGLLATPLAKRVARTHGVELERLSGSGPRGRITRADVLTAAGVTETPPTAPPAPASDDSDTQEPTRVQRLIARRMSESRATIPDFEVETDAIMDEVLRMRASLKDAIDQDEQALPSLNDFVVKACAIALRRHPRVNASYTDGRFKLHRQINIGIAVATDDALVVPTVFGADSKSLGTIARETRRLAARVRSGEITPPELSRGTFTVSNLGMFGMTAIRPVINPPQVAILGVGAIRETLARREEEIVDRRLMTLTLSADHRILYGADAARFLADVKSLLESPLKLAL
ncbi:MAG TPA: dihydrolipoamide acetyltransferase family protein [Solirubrobacteraceae bacterium]|nr:dihydrolipoamide acetyltransferase family protein [Solirubrobacteraceae bacterium]